MAKGLTALDSEPSSAAGAEIRELAAAIKFVLAAARKWSEAMSNVRGFSAGPPSAWKATPARTLHSLTKSDEKVRVNFDLGKDKHTALKIYAVSQGKSMMDVLTE
jgi:hypothetical protein